MFYTNDLFLLYSVHNIYCGNFLRAVGSKEIAVFNIIVIFKHLLLITYTVLAAFQSR